MKQTQQPRKMLDKKHILEVIAQELELQGYGKSQQLLLDLNSMNDIITNCKVFPWNSVAERLEMDRWRLYHWYFETFQRMLLGGVDKQDQTTIKNLIREALLKNVPLSKQYQQVIKSKLTQDYHRSSFSIAFNNQKRQVMKELEKDNKLPHHIKANYNEIQAFLSQQSQQIRQIKDSRQVSFAHEDVMQSSPQTKANLDNMIRNFVPAIQQRDYFPQASQQQLMDFLQESSSTTAEFVQTMHKKIYGYNQVLEEHKKQNELLGEDFENQQINYLMEQLKKLQEEATELQE
ncbi:Conserved_hypothetical protein [Hexamita inflata]|uniref:Uncharacterized protein n=1 Tax=Hexamita inflata TaxID=28002 RepID=A0AA86QT37_9EUKA|nr:Conserved hypothetical protein [Hexamita inflata]